MILSPLPIRDLSRALSVSKRWNKTILDSEQHRRTLFLEPEPVEKYLELKSWDNDSKFQLTIVYEPIDDDRSITNCMIAEPHPGIALGCQFRSTNSQDVRGMSLERLKTVSPETLLFQPPLEDIDVRYGAFEIEELELATFGALVKFLEKTRMWAEEIIFHGENSFPGQLQSYRELLDGTNDSISIMAHEVVASYAGCVKRAREATE